MAFLSLRNSGEKGGCRAKRVLISVVRFL